MLAPCASGGVSHDGTSAVVLPASAVRHRTRPSAPAPASDPPPSHTVPACMHLTDVDTAGSNRALWHNLCRSAKEAASEGSTGKPLKCSAGNVERALQKLRGARLALALDLYKARANVTYLILAVRIPCTYLAPPLDLYQAGPHAPIIEVVSVWSLPSAFPALGGRRSRNATGAGPSQG